MLTPFSAGKAGAIMMLILSQVDFIQALPQGVRDANYASLSNSTLTPEVAVKYTQVEEGSAQILPAPLTSPDTTGTLATSLDTAGRKSSQPFPTKVIPSPTALVTVTFTKEVLRARAACAPDTIETAAAPPPLGINTPSTGNYVATSQLGVDAQSAAAGNADSVSPNSPNASPAAAPVIPGSPPAAAAGNIAPASTPQIGSTAAAPATSGANPATMPLASSPMASAPAASPAPAAAAASSQASPASGNIFLAVGRDAPPANIARTADHPAPRQGIAAQTDPISTNKFYANFFLGSQTQPTWTHPYSVSWSRGSGNAQSYGLSISHIDDEQKAYAPGNPPQYYLNPNGIQSMILSAAELAGSTSLSMDSLQSFSANVNLHPQAGAGPAVTFPLVQGMGFVTGKYSGATPVIQSSVFFRTITRVQEFSGSGGQIAKFRFVLEDGKTWLVYAAPEAGSQGLTLQVLSNSRVQATAPFSGIIQVAKVPAGSSEAEAIYDAAAGGYATAADISGSVNGASGSYTLKWTKAGISSDPSPLVMFALPHHVQSFDPTTGRLKTSLTLQTTTKGVATAVLADEWILVEQSLPIDMDFAPWDPSLRSRPTLSATARRIINEVAMSEVSQDIDAQSNLDSMYFSGKALSKFATLMYTVNDLAQNASLAQAGLTKLKTAFAVFAENRQQFPLLYETAWKGTVSSGAYVTGDAGQDFGNTYYNDHHFHYGYFIHAAAVIGYLDPSWIPANKDWVNMLVRDAANPSRDDAYYPVSRAFDWYHGHSWAKGLFESGDGKDEESSSEDAFFAYALKMWGKVVGDSNMEARGNLMLAILTRTLQNYFLMEDSNRNQPPAFVPNKVTGILFENKADHATYFGLNTEYIQGIHMIPINPASALTRTKTFVSEEWTRYFDNGRVDQVAGGWRGILYANLAIINPTASFNFFAQGNFQAEWLDGGASRSWYLAYAAGE
ncbi:MAG: hypothetical protein M1817_005921 [Caeruleum heppii]|nr:MAG: hypothetical protein M1817_005921 [Caeruleum heppii]